MRAFTEPLQELEEFQKIQQALKKQSIQVTGCIDAQKAHFIYAAGAAKKKLIVTYSELRAKELCENYRLFDKNVLFYPAKDLIFYSADVQSNLLVQQRIRVLQKLMEEEEVTIVTTMGGIMDHLLPPEVFQKQIETVESDSEFDMELWKKKLTAMGYERVGQVEGSGQFAVRGGILDIFPLTEENPVRIELWGDEIDSIRSFDVESQRSIENLDRIRIYPAGEFIADDGRIKKGLAVLEKEAKRLADQFFQERKTEESARLKAFAEEVKQSLTQWKQMSVLDGLAPYFYDRMVSFAEYFPKEQYKAFLCYSWMLYPPMQMYLSGNSNIRQFAGSFRIIGDCSDSAQAKEFLFANGTRKEIAAKATSLQMLALTHPEKLGYACGIITI